MSHAVEDRRPSHPPQSARELVVAAYPLGADGVDVGFRPYRVAGQAVSTDLHAAWLNAFRVDEAGQQLDRSEDLPSQGPEIDSQELRAVFAGQVWLSARQTSIICRVSDQHYVVGIGGVGDFVVQAGGDAVLRIHPDTGVGEEELALASFGAPFILACALRDTWSLHASAVSLDGDVVAFTAESGYGKSTMAQYLAGEGGAGCGLAADDILPVSVKTGVAMAYPDYPQFKLPVTAQPHGPWTGGRTLRALIALDAPSAAEPNIRITRLNEVDAALVVAGSTVASRLFGPGLLADHLTFCARLARAVPVYRLHYPRRRALLPQVRDAIIDGLRTSG